MFDKLKAMGALTSLMKNQDKIKESMSAVRAHLAETRVRGQAGAGAAWVVMTGELRVVEVELSPALVAGMAADEKTRVLAGSLIAEAVNDATRQAQLKIKEAMDKESEKLGLGELGSGLGGMLGGA